MAKLTRRNLGIAAAASLAASSARAQPATTDGLPKTYSGATLNVLWGPEPVNAAMAEYSRAFTDATGITFTWTNVAHTERYQKIILDTASRTNSFDIYLNAYQWKEELAPYVIDHATIEHDVPGAPPLDLADYPARALAVQGKVGAKLMALPLNGSVTFLVWNKKAYREVGLDPEAAPKTWDEVYANGQKLTHGNQYGYNLPAGKNIQDACQWITIFRGAGGDYLDAKGQPAFNAPPALAATRMMVDKLLKISPPGALTWDNPEMINAVATGQSAQGFMWTGGFSTLLDPAKSVVSHDLGYAPTPQGALLGGWAVSVNAKSKQLAAAKLYVAWLTSKRNAVPLALLTGQPARTSAFQDPSVVARFPLMPAVLQGMEGQVAEYPPIKQSEQICQFIYNEMNAVCAGDQTAEQGVAQMQTRVTEFMKRRGYLRG